MDAQQGLHCKGLLTPASGFGRVRLYERDQFSPGHHQFHGVQELALAGALDCVAQAQAALLHATIVWASSLLNHIAAVFVQRVPSGKTTFFTKLGFLAIRRGDLFRTSENALKIINPANNMNA